jgi:hypothetical protein
LCKWLRVRLGLKEMDSRAGGGWSWRWCCRVRPCEAVLGPASQAPRPDKGSGGRRTRADSGVKIRSISDAQNGTPPTP